MSPDNISKFAKQFRHEYIAYPGAEEFTYKNVVLRQFTDKDLKPELIGEYLVRELDNARFVNPIIAKFREETAPHSHCLLNYILKINRIFNHYAEEDEYAAHFFNNLSAALSVFIDLVNNFRNDVPFLSRTLEQTSAEGPDNSSETDDTCLHQTLEVIEFYLNNLAAYYYYFNDLLQNETNNGNKIQSTSLVAYHLCRLLPLIEQIIVDIEFSHDIILTWETATHSREQQALYN